MDDLEEGLRSRVKLSGRIACRLPSGREVTLTSVEATCRGTFAEPEGLLKLQLEGPFETLAELASAHPGIAALAGSVRSEEGASATVTLESTRAHAAKLAAAARGTDLAPQALLENVAWMTALFDLAGYTVVSVGTVRRWSEPVS